MAIHDPVIQMVPTEILAPVQPRLHIVRAIQTQAVTPDTVTVLHAETIPPPITVQATAPIVAQARLPTVAEADLLVAVDLVVAATAVEVVVAVEAVRVADVTD